MHPFFEQFSKVGSFFESTFIAGFGGEEKKTILDPKWEFSKILMMVG